MGHCVCYSILAFEIFIERKTTIFFRRLTRKHVLSANTQFTCAQFFPTGVQVLATGTDRKISYWEVFDGSLVRDVEGSKRGCINCLSINSTGQVFITGGSDQILKVRNTK